MDYKTIQARELEAIVSLPESLRSEQCYNDIQHSMLIFLFRHALKAVRAGDAAYTDLLMDNITIYLYIHFLAEEEGMVFSMDKGIYDRVAVAEHASAHQKFLEHWMNANFEPYKSGASSQTECYEGLRTFYGLFIKHIDEADQATYGAKLVVDPKNHRAESAFVARSNIPLSPLMAGAFDTVMHLDQAAARLIDTSKLSALALRPLPRMNLIKLAKPLNASDSPCLRDRFHASMAQSNDPMHRVG